MPFASKCDTSSSTHFIFNYTNINAFHLATLHFIETLTHYGKNEDYGESAVTPNFVWHWKNASVFWNCAHFEFNCMFAQKGSWVRVG